MILMRRGCASRGRAGSALLIATIAMTTIVGLSVAVLQISSTVTSRQSMSVDDKRAFYLAEAGLAEAYLGLARGYTGQIGSFEEPVAVGDGLCWVDAVSDGELVTLAATAVCGRGRAAVEVTVKPYEQSLGIFADEGVNLTSSFLLDGYDSEAGSYDEQTGAQTITLRNDPNRDPAGRPILRDGKMFYLGSVTGKSSAGIEITYTASLNRDKLFKAETTYDDAAVYFGLGSGPQDEQDFDEISLDSGATTGESDAYSEVAVGDAALSSGLLGPTTGIGGTLTTNGPVEIFSADGSPIEVFGDIFHGVDSTADVGSEVLVTGSIVPSRRAIELSPVSIPEVEMLPGFVHASVIPRVIPTGSIGYDYIDVESGAELVVMGGSELVAGDLILREGAHLSIANGDGSVDIFVLDNLELMAGSTLEVESQAPVDLTLQVDASGLADLRSDSAFRGLVYAPGAPVFIGADFEVFGSLLARTLELEAGARLHYDSGIEGVLGRIKLPRMMGWTVTEVPEAIRVHLASAFSTMRSDDDDDDDGPSLEDALVSESWTAYITAWGEDPSGPTKAPLLESYEGPFDKYSLPDEWATIIIDTNKLEPPEVGDLTWFISVRFLNQFGDPQEYSGTVQSMPKVTATSFDELDLWYE